MIKDSQHSEGTQSTSRLARKRRWKCRDRMGANVAKGPVYVDVVENMELPEDRCYIALRTRPLGLVTGDLVRSCYAKSLFCSRR